MQHQASSRREKLLQLVSQVTSNKANQTEIELLLEGYGMTQQEMVDAFLQYNLDVNIWDSNDIYKLKQIRLALYVHNLIPGSWHQDRQQTMLEFIDIIKPKNAVDIAFGVPGKYVRHLLQENKNPYRLHLLDREDDALLFAKTLLGIWNSNWPNTIELDHIDMDENKYMGDFDLYIFQDAIEHTLDPTSYLDTIVKNSPAHAKFLISLPRGPLLTMHYIAWETAERARAWINDRGLSIAQERFVFVKPEVDLFSEDIADDFSDLYMICTKV